MEIRAERTSGASCEAVWAVMTDIEASAEVITGITGVERLDGGDGFGVGTRWRETRVMFGREASEEMEVVEVREHAYDVEAVHGSTTYRSTMTVEPDGDGSRISMTFGAEQRGLMARAMAATVGRLAAGSTRRAIEQDLADIARAAEAR